MYSAPDRPYPRGFACREGTARGMVGGSPTASRAEMIIPVLRKSVLALVGGSVVACIAAVAAPAPANEPDQPAPTLAVLIVVDQLPMSLVSEYEDLFSRGLRRLLDEGLAFANASHFHAVTETAAGHATLATGSYPSEHGVVSNKWSHDSSGGRTDVYAVEDTTSPLLGVEFMEGRSPANLQHDGLADWILDRNEAARVLSVSSKDRAAIPMGGRAPAANVFWVATPVRRFVTSSYYAEELPEWVESFNTELMPAFYADSVWLNQVPAEMLARARPDSAWYEGDGVHTTFPHVFAEEGDTVNPGGFAGWVAKTPILDRAVLAFVEEGIAELELGGRGALDFLAISFSQTDYVGHDYGPRSLEQLDNLLRLDAVLGDLLELLDEQVGEDGWALAFSSDHGALEAPEWREEQGLVGHRVTREELLEMFADVNEALAAGGSRTEVRQRMARAAERSPIIEKAYLDEGIVQDPPPDTFAVLFRHSYWPDRWTGIMSRFGVEVRPPPGTLIGPLPFGTSHLGPNWYDRHVPLVFLGPTVTPGRSDEGVHTVDLAPTLAQLVGLEVPADLSGGVLFR